jgi:hypothetical protein
VVALSMLGHFPVDLVERALLDEGTDMVLVLAKAAGCSWTTAKALVLMQTAKRGMSPEDLESAFNSFDRLSEQTAQRVLKFHERRTKLRAAVTKPTAPSRNAQARTALQPTVQIDSDRPAPDGDPLKRLVGSVA